MSLYGWCQWLEQTRPAVALAESIWAFPIIEGCHILALPLSVGMIVVFDLHLLGLTLTGAHASKIMSEMIRWSRVGFAVMFLTGVLLFMTHAGKAYGNPFFRTKLTFLVLLGINAAVFQAVFYRRMPEWAVGGRAPFGARFCAVFSLVIWIGVIVCGRTMAYQF
jgi:hypothetical protein